MPQVITQAATEAAKAEIMAIKEAENPINAARSMQVLPETGSSPLKQ